MSEHKTENEDLPEYENFEEDKTNNNENNEKKLTTKFVGAHSMGFKDLLLKPELLRAIGEAAFEHPSEVQQECIPQGILGMDILCQAKSGYGKTAVFVLTILQRMEKPNTCNALILCHTRELAYQIRKEFERFSKYFPDIRTTVIFGGAPIRDQRELLKNNPPHIIVGTPGRVLSLARERSLPMNKIEYFVLDECDKMLEYLDMRADVQAIFKMTPRDKQVMMFSATLSKDIRNVCRMFMQHVSFTILLIF